MHTITANSKITLFDVPSSAGCLDQGTELLPRHFRKHGLVDRLSEIGFEITDLGEVSVPALQRHNTPPIRNYPLPKTVWENTDAFIERHMVAHKDSLIFGLGGDCSIVVGAISGLIRIYGTENIHLLYLDGDVDSMAPDPDKCIGSAGMGLWLLTQESKFWNGNKLLPSQIMVIGNKKAPDADVGIPFITLQRLREKGIKETMKQVLSSIPDGTHIFVHFDVDILSEDEMPCAYVPRKEGLSVAEVETLLKSVLIDDRLDYFELTEFMPQKDPDGRFAKALTEILARVFSGITATL